MTCGVKKEPGKLVPPDAMIPLRREGTTVQMRGDSNVGRTCVNGYYAMCQNMG